MSERQDTSIMTKDGKRLTTTVSTEFWLIKLEPDGGHEIILDLNDFKLLTKWVEGKK